MKKIGYCCSLLLCALLCACSEMNFDLPQGPQGRDGKSAYEVWKDAVESGQIEWPSDRTEIADYLIYIKGEKGDRGTDGLSAYEQWKRMIAGGQTADPHAPSVLWPASRNTEADFWNFLTGQDGSTPYIGSNGNWWIGSTDTGVRAAGQDGLSAYELWKKAVLDGTVKWPESKTGLSDFFFYLKGRDGQDGAAPHIGENGNWWIGSTDTGVQAAGQDGQDGLSAYALWKKDVEAGKIVDKDGKRWPADKTEASDFYSYLSGRDGQDGKSAYELWWEMAASGNLENPKSPGSRWPANETAENDFFRYLTGKDGNDGLSAYELWKKDLEARKNTDRALVDHRTGEVWPEDRNTLDDFFDYLRGKDGQDGKDGKPGVPGQPGTEVKIIQGIPNVIAQYSQSEFGEYVRTTDGGVLYRVYDEKGELAPDARIKGMPGLPANKVYMSDAKGEFIVPKEDLPEIHELESRWGTVKEVVLANGTARESAKNTYVPNRVRIRVVLRDGSNSVSDVQNLSFRVQRKIDPESEWQDLPSYLPDCEAIRLDAYRVSGKDDPQKILPGKVLRSSCYFNAWGTGYLYSLQVYRFVMKNPGGMKNGQNDFWDGTDVFYSAGMRGSYYGEKPCWNGVCLLAPYQLGPYLKSLKLKSVSGGANPNFASAEGEFDFSHIDFTKISKGTTTRTVQANGVDLVEPDYYTQEEARNLRMAYVTFRYNSPAGWQEASSSNNMSSTNVPDFKVLGLFLNSSIQIMNYGYYTFCRYNAGYLKKKADSDGYCVSSTAFPEVTVTYEK